MKTLNYPYYSNMIYSDYNDPVHAIVVLLGQATEEYFTYGFIMAVEALMGYPSPFRYAN